MQRAKRPVERTETTDHRRGLAASILIAHVSLLTLFWRAHTLRACAEIKKILRFTGDKSHLCQSSELLARCSAPVGSCAIPTVPAFNRRWPSGAASGRPLRISFELGLAKENAWSVPSNLSDVEFLLARQHETV